MTAQRMGALVVAVLALVAAIALVVRGVREGATVSPEVGRPDADGVLVVDLVDQGFQPGRLILPTEEPIELVLTNRDDVSHQVAFGRLVVERDGQQIGFADDLLAGLGIQVRPGSALVGPSADHDHTVIVVAPGETVRLGMTLPSDRAGEWQVACFTAGGCYYRAGLTGTIIVE